MGVGAWSRAAARRGLEAVRNLPPRAILAVGYLLFVLWGFPGYMSSDSVVQLVEARSGHFTDGHPPIMSAQWQVLDALVSGPLLMLLLQGALFLGGLHGLLRRVLSAGAAALAAVLVLLFPPVLTTMAVIWKDSQMAAYMLAGTAALVSPRRGVRLVGLGLVSAGCAFRYNAAVVALPLVGLLFEWRPGLRWWKRYAISALAAVATVIVAFAVNRALTVEHQKISFAIGDVVGVIAFTHDRSDDDLREVLRDTPLRSTTGIQATARKLYWPRNSYHLTNGPERMFDKPRTDRQLAALSRAWRELVRGDFRAYLDHRLAMYKELLGLTEERIWSPVYNGFTENAEQVTWIDHNASWSRYQQKLSFELGDLTVDTVLFQVYLYALLALALLVLVCRDRLTLALLAGGLLYELTFFPAAATPDFRYSHWMITCTCLSAVLLFCERLRRGRAARDRAAGSAA